MKSLSILAFSALVVFVSAVPDDSASSTSVALSPQESCAIGCAADDICCKAGCFHVPCPDEGMANRTTECAMQCPQGNGTQAETEAYASCQLSCINSYFYTGTATLPTSEGTAPASHTGTGTGAAATGGSSTGGSGSGTASPTGTGTDASSAPKSTAGAASAHYQLGSSAAGIIGLVLAALAL